jgi:hypothetical protein
MERTKNNSARIWKLAIGLAIPTMIIVGCATNETRSDSAMMSDEQLALLPEDAMRGAQIWADNCIRCHNFRSPRSFTDRKWEVIMMHMRVRAGLTGEEARQVLKFIQAAN